ncbi:MAG: hypothetical protein ACLU9S_20245 [Oscillospiraceae bacterium]
MNWKREAADKLRNYEAHREALDSIPKGDQKAGAGLCRYPQRHHGRHPGFRRREYP